MNRIILRDLASVKKTKIFIYRIFIENNNGFDEVEKSLIFSKIVTKIKEWPELCHILTSSVFNVNSHVL